MIHGTLQAGRLTSPMSCLCSLITDLTTTRCIATCQPLLPYMRGRVSARLALLHCRRLLTLNQTSDVVIRTNAARRCLQEGDDVLSQQPLAAGAHFFSTKSPNPSEQEIVAVPSRMTPAPHAEALLTPRTNVSKTSGPCCPSLLYAVILTYTRYIHVSCRYCNTRGCLATYTNDM